MRRYFSTLHRQPDEHKKRFAFVVSGFITLFIFGVWSMATFGNTSGGILADKENNPASGGKVSEVSPFQSLRLSLASSFEAIGSSFGELKSGLDNINFNTEYSELRDGALDTYGQ